MTGVSTYLFRVIFVCSCMASLMGCATGPSYKMVDGAMLSIGEPKGDGKISFIKYYDQMRSFENNSVYALAYEENLQFNCSNKTYYYIDTNYYDNMFGLGDPKAHYVYRSKRLFKVDEKSAVVKNLFSKACGAENSKHSKPAENKQDSSPNVTDANRKAKNPVSKESQEALDALLR